MHEFNNLDAWADECIQCGIQPCLNKRIPTNRKSYHHQLLVESLLLFKWLGRGNRLGHNLDRLDKSRGTSPGSHGTTWLDTSNQDTRLYAPTVNRFKPIFNLCEWKETKECLHHELQAILCQILTRSMIQRPRCQVVGRFLVLKHAKRAKTSESENSLSSKMVRRFLHCRRKRYAVASIRRRPFGPLEKMTDPVYG
jgi:hypothetical protein